MKRFITASGVVWYLCDSGECCFVVDNICYRFSTQALYGITEAVHVSFPDADQLAYGEVPTGIVHCLDKELKDTSWSGQAKLALVHIRSLFPEKVQDETIRYF